MSFHKCHYFHEEYSWNIDTNVLFYEVRVVSLCRILHEGDRGKSPLRCGSSLQEVLVTNNMAICTNAPPSSMPLSPAFYNRLQQVTILHFSVRCPLGLLYHSGLTGQRHCWLHISQRLSELNGLYPHCTQKKLLDILMCRRWQKCLRFTGD